MHGDFPSQEDQRVNCFGMNLLERASKGFSELPLLRKICLRAGLLQRKLPVFQHLTSSPLTAVAPIRDTSPQTIRSDKNCLERAVSKKGQAGPFSDYPQPSPAPPSHPGLWGCHAVPPPLVAVPVRAASSATNTTEASGQGAPEPPCLWGMSPART